MPTEYGDRELAERHTILRFLVGSGVHGTALDGVDDRDEMGIFVQPRTQVIGLDRMDQYVYRTQDEGERSGHGDLDLTIYSLRKWVALAAAGNPTVLLGLFVPPEYLMVETAEGKILRDRADLFVSRQAANRFLGYLEAQRQKMLGLRGNRTNRPELVAVHGFDTKFAMHAVRLGFQGVELMTTGRITLPVPQPLRWHLLELRQGNRTRTWALSQIDTYTRQLVEARDAFAGPERPSGAALNRLLIDLHEMHWAASDSQGQETRDA